MNKQRTSEYACEPLSSLRHRSAREGLHYGLILSTIVFLMAGAAGAAETIYVPLRSFGNPLLSGREPLGEMIEGTNGVLYGTTSHGGLSDGGTVFRVDKSGSNYLVLHSFTGSSDGANPQAGLVQATDGFLYGTTFSGGSNDLGTVFRLSVDGSNYSILKTFSDGPTTGANPGAGLIEGSDGMVYGTTQFGGTSNAGTIFRLDKGGGGYELLHSFGITTNDGKFPYAGVLESHHGVLYGTASEGGTNGAGIVFAMSKDGADYMVLRHLKESQNPNPHGKLLQHTNGLLYGTSLTGFRVFRINTNGSGYATMSLPNGGTVEAGLVQGGDGALYGVTTDGGTNNCGSIFRLPISGFFSSTLYNFTALGADGRGPRAALLKVSDGLLYGSTSFNTVSGNGTIFRLNTSGAEYQVITTLSWSGWDGSHPNSPLIDGEWVYGTTEAGGSQSCGTIFRLRTDGTAYQILRNFESGTNVSGPADGRLPRAGLIKASDGILYGTTSQGGTNLFGTVFRIGTNGGGYQIIKHLVSGDVEAQIPQSALTEGADGALYGTSTGLGPGTGWPFTNYGSVFKLTKDGSVYSVIHSFAGVGSDGRYPSGQLVRGTDDSLYGVTSGGGTGGSGTVFRVSQDGTVYSVLHNFPDSPGDGKSPVEIVKGVDGVLYGLTGEGGAYGNYGTIFKLNNDGTGYTILKSFQGGSNDPHRPLDLVEGVDGYLYVSTAYGGVKSYGALIRMAKDNTSCRVILDFTFTPYRVTGELTGGDDNLLYSSTAAGGDMNAGTVSKLFPPPEIIATRRLSNGAFQLTVRGAPGPAYRIERSTNFHDWISLTNLMGPGNPFEFFDHSAKDLPLSFYRAVWLPQ